ncbi:MAG: SprB repeat-containing protein, partial [Bacteroidia bacterium]
MKPIITKSKFAFIGTIIFLLFLLGVTSTVNAQTLIAGWDFQTTTTGGVAVLAAPNTQKVYPANFGAGTIYFNGTNNSSNWVSGGANTELNAFTGTGTVNVGSGFSTVTTSPACLALVGGSGCTTCSSNGKYAVFSFSMTGYINLVVSYASQRTATGYSSQIWEYSTNGTTWTPLQTVTTVPIGSFGLVTLPTVTGLNGASTAFLRFSGIGATAAAGNNRLDNIQLSATAGFPFNVGPISGSPFCISDDNAAVVNVPYAYGGTFNPGNILTAQLSSSTGSFASPINIGTLSTTVTAGSITASIPAGTASGTGYRIRVVSSDPIATSNNNGVNLTIDKVVAVASNSGPVCAGLSLQLFSNGGTTYSWTGPNAFSNSNQNPTIATTVAADSGVYLVTAVSTLGCTDTASTLAIVQTCGCLPPTITSSVQQPSCNGGSNGSIDITVSGGVSPYTFQWSTTAVTEDVSGLSAGVYSVIVTDNILCTDTFYIAVGQPTSISPSVVVTNPGCPGTSDGSINLSVSGGTPGYTYLWDTGATTEDVSGLSAGLYSVTITDNNGCITFAFGVLTNPGVFSLTSINSDVTCAGINNGSINLIASNDTSNNSNPGILISEFLANPAGT